MIFVISNKMHASAAEYKIDPFNTTSNTKMIEMTILTSVGPNKPESMEYLLVIL